MFETTNQMGIVYNYPGLISSPSTNMAKCRGIGNPKSDSCVSQYSQFSLKVARSRGQNKPNDDLQEYFDLILQRSSK